MSTRGRDVPTDGQDVLVNFLANRRKDADTVPNLTQFEEILAELRQIEQGGAKEEDTSKSFASSLMDILGEDPSQFLPSAGLLATSAVEAVVKPFINLAELPGELLSDLGMHRAAGVVFSVADEARNIVEHPTTLFEQAVLDAGVTQEQVNFSKGTGHFIGYVVPMATAIKAASLLPLVGTAGKLGAKEIARITGSSPFTKGFAGQVLRPNVVRDASAGAMFGFLGTQGDLGERLGEAKTSAAFFGLISVLSTGGIGTITAWRNRRYNDLVTGAKLDAALRKQGEIAVGDARTVADAFKVELVFDGYGVSNLAALNDNNIRTVIQLMNEESLILRSPAAATLLDKAITETALVEALQSSMHRRGMNRGIVKDVATTDLKSTMESLSEQFPGLTFQRLRNPAGGIDIIFGESALSKQAQRQYARDRVFVGQRVAYGTGELEVVGVTGLEVITRIPGTKNIVKIPKAEVNTLPYGVVDAGLRVPDREALGRNFWEFLNKRTDDAITADASVPQYKFLTDVSTGRLNIDEFAKVVRLEPNAIIYPEEVGLTARGLPSDRPVGGKLMEIPLQEGMAPQEIIPISMTQRAQTGSLPLSENLQPRSQLIGHMKVLRRQGSTLHLEVPVGRDGQPIKMSMGQMAGIGDDILQGDPSLARVQLADGRILRESPEILTKEFGGEFGWMINPAEAVNFSDLAMTYLRQTGVSGKDLPYFTVFLTQDVRRRLLASIPKSDRVVWERIQKQLYDNISAANSLEEVAAIAGYRVNRKDGVIFLEDMSSGPGFVVDSESAAISGLLKVQRATLDQGANAIPKGLISSPNFTAMGRDVADTYPIWQQDIGNLGNINIPSELITPLRDWLLRIEEQSGLKLWSAGFNKLDTALQAAKLETRPWINSLSKTYKRIPVRDRIDIANFWQESLDKGLDRIGRVKAAQEFGLSTKQIAASEATINMMNLAGSGRYLELYYGKIRPFIEEHKRLPDWEVMFPDGMPREVRGMARKGGMFELSYVEKDPLAVAYKWIKTDAFNRNARDHWDRLADLVGDPSDPLRMIKGSKRFDVAPLQQHQIDNVTRAFGEGGIKQLQRGINEYLTQIRGQPGNEFLAMRRFSTRLFDALGVKVDPRTGEQLVNAYLSVQFGSALGLAPAVISRNLTQNMWFSYTRLGNRWGAEALKIAMTHAGYMQPLRAGAIRPRSSGVPLGDIINENVIELMPTGHGVVGAATERALKLALWGGRKGQQLSGKLLTFYSSSDDINRAWAFWWQRLHTQEFLNKFEGGRMSARKFREDGMPFFTETVRDEFMKIRRLQGNDIALDFIGKVAADEAHFIYGNAASPMLLQRPFGRLFSTFGTWAIWSKEFYAHRVKLGTPTQRAALVMRTLAVGGALGNIGHEIGVNVWNWMAPISPLTYTGSPFFDVALDFRDIVDAAPDRRGAAVRRMVDNIGRLSFPGQRFARDVTRVAATANSPAEWVVGLAFGSPKIEFSDFPNRVMLDTGSNAVKLDKAAAAAQEAQAKFRARMIQNALERKAALSGPDSTTGLPPTP